MTSYSFIQLHDTLQTILGPEVDELVETIRSSDNLVILPSTKDVNLTPLEVSRLVAETSNRYSKACRMAGISRAQYKLAVGKYKMKFRTSLTSGGRNKEEREASALSLAKTEYEEMVVLEAVVELAESLESSCRIASESARRMLLGTDQKQQADSRTERFDFSAGNEF